MGRPAAWPGQRPGARRPSLHRPARCRPRPARSASRGHRRRWPPRRPRRDAGSRRPPGRPAVAPPCRRRVRRHGLRAPAAPRRPCRRARRAGRRSRRATRRRRPTARAPASSSGRRRRSAPPPGRARRMLGPPAPCQPVPRQPRHGPAARAARADRQRALANRPMACASRSSSASSAASTTTIRPARSMRAASSSAEARPSWPTWAHRSRLGIWLSVTGVTGSVAAEVSVTGLPFTSSTPPDTVRPVAKSRADDRDRVRRPGGAGRFDFGQERAPQRGIDLLVQALDAGLSQALDVGAHDPGGLIGGQGATVRRDRQHLGLPVAGQRLVGAADGVRAPAGAHELHRGVARTGQVVRHDGDHGIQRFSARRAQRRRGHAFSPSTATGFSSPARFRKYDASTGARIELISTQAATWAVAVPTYCWNEGSAAATTAGWRWRCRRWCRPRSPGRSCAAAQDVAVAQVDQAARDGADDQAQDQAADAA